MEMYPVVLRVADRRCVVIGGGSVAERKVRSLLAAGASCVVISPDVTEYLDRLSAAGQIELKQRQYREGDLHDAALAFAATDDDAVNVAVCEEAALRGIWVNDAMSPDRSTFHVPAVLTRGDMQVAVSTSGSAPRLASVIRDEVAEHYGDEYADYVRMTGALRRRLRSLPELTSKQKQYIYERWIDTRALHLDRLRDERIIQRELADEQKQYERMIEELLDEWLATIREELGQDHPSL